MTSEPEPRVLVPFRVLEDAPSPAKTVGMVASVDVVLLGYHKVPEQTAPGQMQMQYEDEARAELEEVAGSFRSEGANVDTRLVFTPDPPRTYERIADEESCTSILLARPSERMERLLVPIRGDVNLSRLTHVTARLLEDNEMKVTLLHVADSEEDVEAGELMLRGVREHLADHGLDPDRVTLNVGTAEDPLDTVIDAAHGFDGLVLGETDPSLADAVFGEAHERIAEGYDGPILIVRRSLHEDVPSVPEDPT